MNLNSIRTARLRVVAIAIAALAFTFGVLAADRAEAASSGGISTASGPAGDSDRKTRNSKRYDRLWRKVSRRDKRWARRTAKCESGLDPKAIGGGGRYRGAFQFLRSTWRSAPKSPGGDPIRYPYRTQAVVAIALKKRDGAGHWPNCG